MECPMDSSYIVKGGFPKGVEYMGGSCTPSIGGGALQNLMVGGLSQYTEGEHGSLKRRS